MTDNEENVDLSERFEAVDGMRGHCVCGNYFHYLGGLDVGEIEIVCEECGRRLEINISAEVIEHKPSNTYDEEAFRKAVESHIRRDITDEELKNKWECFGHPDKDFENTVDRLKSYLVSKVVKDQIALQLGVTSSSIHTNLPKELKEQSYGSVIIDGDEYYITEPYDESRLDKDSVVAGDEDEG